MRCKAIVALAVLFYLSVGTLQAQQKPKLSVPEKGLRVGYASAAERTDSGRLMPVYRAGCWAPVYLDLTTERELSGTEGLIEVTIETPDHDGDWTNITSTYPLEPTAAKKTFTVMGYTKMAGSSGEMKVTVKLVSSGDTLAYLQVGGTSTSSIDFGVERPEILHVCLGTHLTSLKQVIAPDEPTPNKPANYQTNHILGFIDKVANLPDRWYGYDGVSTIFITTGSGSFIPELRKTENKARRDAIVDWVRRGGRLVLCCGRYPPDVTATTELNEILPVILGAGQEVAKLQIKWADGQSSSEEKGPITIAETTRKPGRGVRVLATASAGNSDLVVEGAYGLGRVAFVAFDPEQPPFSKTKGQQDFWTKFMGGKTRELRDPRFEENYNPGYNYNNPELMNTMQRRLDDFEKVPVISFGWVALFIFLYILVVGPIDYFFLKKVVKRLELTWITFPTVVLAVSAIAYFTAYWIKGSELRINKVDVVDIDMESGQSYGHTWFTLFSPRIQHYTLTVQPNQPAWASPAPETSVTTPMPVLMTWMGQPENQYGGGMGGGKRGSSGILGGRHYSYEPGGTALRAVPIQVWSTKSFTASWQAPFSSESKPIEYKLRLDNAGQLEGEISWQPGKEGAEPLEGATLLYQGKYESLGELAPGKAKLITQPRNDLNSSWVNLSTLSGGGRYGRPSFPGEEEPTLPLGEMMKFATIFSGESNNRSGNNFNNNGLRRLDQWWRVRPDPREGGDFAILFGWLKSKTSKDKTQETTAEEVTRSFVSPSQLWIGTLPDKETTRPTIPGFMRQETFVRVFIPVTGQAKPKEREDQP